MNTLPKSIKSIMGRWVPMVALGLMLSQCTEEKLSEPAPEAVRSTEDYNTEKSESDQVNLDANDILENYPVIFSG